MDKTLLAKAVADVRRCGATNMFNRRQVIEILDSFGYSEEAEYLTHHKSEYTDILKLSAEY